jgi:hypothetical protein
MGPQLGPIYNALTNELVWLHGKWSQYRQLFAVSDKRIDLLNQTAGYFFGVIQITMFDDVLLHLARLTDPCESRKGKEIVGNLTLRQLPEFASDPTIKANLADLVDKAHAACTVARDWRNRRIAHSDLTLALATSKDPLDGVSRADVEKALEAFRKALNLVEGHYS